MKYIINVSSIYLNQGDRNCLSKSGELCRFGDGESVFDSEYDSAEEAINQFLSDTGTTRRSYKHMKKARYKIKKGFVTYSGDSLGELKKVYAKEGKPSKDDKELSSFDSLDEAYKAFDALVDGATHNNGLLLRTSKEEAKNKKDGIYEFIYLTNREGFPIDTYYENVRLPKNVYVSTSENSGIIDYEIYADNNIHNCYELLSTEGEARTYAKWLSNNMKGRLIQIFGTTRSFMNHWNGENWDEAFKHNILVAEYKNGRAVKKNAN